MKRRRICSLASVLLLGFWVVVTASAQVTPIEEAEKLIQQAKSLLREGDYEAGIVAAQRAREIRQQTLGEHPDTAAALLILASLYRTNGELDRAESLCQQALAMSEKVSGPDSLQVASALNTLANVYLNAKTFSKAEPLYLRVLAIREKTLGAEHLETLNIVNNIGIFYEQTGELGKAESFLQRALAVREQVLGPMHPSIAESLLSLSHVYYGTSDYHRAEQLNLRAVAISEATLGPEHPITGRRIASLATLYEVMGEFAKAEALLLREAAIYEKALPPEHTFTAANQTSLGSLYLAMGNLAKAQVFLEHGLALTEKTSGQEHPDTAIDLGHLASIHRFSGAHARALTLAQRGLALTEKGFGPHHPYTNGALSGIASIHWAAGNPRKALPLLQRALSGTAKNSERLLLLGSESSKRAYVQALADEAFKRVSFSLAVPGRDSMALGLNSVLQYKGRVIDAVSDSMNRLRQSLLAEDRELFERLEQVANQFSRLTYQGAGSLSPREYRQSIDQLSNQQDQLEAQMSKRSSEFRRQVTPATEANVRAALPTDAVLVEWFRYRPFDPRAKLVSEQWGAPRYAAYTLGRSGAMLAVDLGLADTVDGLIREFRAAVSDPQRSDVQQRAAALSAQVIAPLHASLRGARHLLLSPDGELNLVPMAALVDAQGQYLAQRFEITLLTSGRDLLRFASTERVPSSNAVMLADPDYGRPLRMFAGASTPTAPQQRSEELDRGGLTFRSLPGTALEAQAIKTLLQEEPMRVLTGEAASETNLKRVHGPRILHLATHGFFLSNQQVREVTSDRAVLPAGVAVENPLLRSGLALAGANARRSGLSDDGILTALEASRLDLRGTQLVVLSACETGLGDTRSGDGVSGLRRGLLLAGARTQVATLWKVADLPTKELMVNLYEHLVEGAGRSAALRRAQNEMMARPGKSHPYYWAGFATIGDWTPLPGG
jgi:CHAT domain-containing protein/lipopolysaccharide biosynthesis regulator YciM